jgi:hypothetical protein
MTCKPTILNISTLIYLFGILLYSLWEYKTLSDGEGWGIVSMAGLAGVGIMTALADLILQRFIKNRIVINILGLLIVVGIAIAIIADL